MRYTAALAGVGAIPNSPQSPVASRRSALAIAAVAAVALLNYAPPWWPLGRDAGVFGYVARVWLGGGQPYRDVWDHKPPGVYLADALALASGIEVRWALWLLSAGAAVLAAYLGARVLVRAFGSPWGVVAASLHAFALVDPKVYQYNDFAEVFGLVFQWLLLAVILRPGAAAAFLAGLAAGAASLFKPTTCALGAVVLADLMRAGLRPSSSGRRSWRRAALFLGGAVLPPAAAVAWLAADGNLADAVDCVVVFNRAYAEPGLVGQIVVAAAQLLYRVPIALLGVPAVAALLWRRPPGEPASEAVRLAGLARLALPLEVVLLALPGRLYGHYFLTLLPALAIGAATFLAAADRRVAAVGRHRRVAATGLVAAGLLLLAADVVLGQRNRWGERLWERVAVREVSARTAADAAVLVWGAELGVNLISGRRAPSRFGYLYPLFTPGYASEAMWRSFLEDLRRDPPALIIDAGFRTSPPTPVPSLDLVVAGEAALPDFARAAVAQMLSRYERSVTREGVVLYSWR